MQTVKLKTSLMHDLCTVIDRIPPKDYTDLKSMRKINGAVEAMRKSLKEYDDKMEKLHKEAEEIMKPYREKLQALNSQEGEEAEAEKKVVEKEANEKLAPINVKILKARETEGDKIAECQMDDNYHTELQEVFQKTAPEQFTVRGAIIEIANALEIKD